MIIPYRTYVPKRNICKIWEVKKRKKYQKTHTAKNLANQAIYNIRQHFFAAGGYLSSDSNCKLSKTSENYRILNSNMAQQILKEVDGMFKSFFGQLKLVKEGKYEAKKCRIPRYLPKDGFTTLIIAMVRLNRNELTLPYSWPYKKQHCPITCQVSNPAY